MKQISIVFSYTLRDGLKKKAFIISTIIMLILIAGISLVPRGIEFFSGDSSGEGSGSGTATYYYIDEEGQIPSGLAALQAAYPEAKIKAGDPGKMEEYTAQIKGERPENVVILVSQVQGQPQIKLINKNFMSGLDLTTAGDVLSKAHGADVLVKSGVSSEVVGQAMKPLPVTVDIVGDMNVSAYVVSLLMTFLVFFAIYYYGYAVAMSIATEKSSRVMETLVVSAKPSHILIGKILAMGTLGLGQLAVIVAFGAACYKLLVPGDFQIGGMSLTLTGIDAGMMAILLVYFILGYTLYAVMNSVCGALVSKIEDLNSAMMPVTLIAIVSFYIGYIAAAMGKSGILQKVALYLPFSSPFAMPSQLVTDQVTPMQVVISLVILGATIVVITFLSARIYAASVLHYGKRQKLTKLYRTRV